MEIIDSNNTISGVSLILGFFDGIHQGHSEVIKTAVDFAKENNAKSLLVTFKTSPAEYFNKNFSYIFTRKKNYKLIETLGVDYLIELDFNEWANVTADDFFDKFIKNLEPISISTGFNYTFGLNREGNSAYLESKSRSHNFEYFCVKPVKFKNEIISSSLIKEKIMLGDLAEANNLLNLNFSISSKVIEGNKIGRELGFPTANLIYPENIVKLPYGVYKARVCNKNAIVNWGLKPTFNNTKEIVEVHILNFDDNLYGKEIEVEFIAKIRDEKKFSTMEELINQIKEDIKCCEL